MDKQTHVILVEDDQRLRHLVSEYLISNNFSVTALGDGKRLLEHVKREDPAIVILDIMLPGQDGFALCRQLRLHYSGPLLFMTAKNDAIDQILGFELGADDYVLKPVEPRVLVARLHALLRRVGSHVNNASDTLQFDNLQIDKSARRVTLSGENIALTSHEFDLLCMLASAAGEVVERDTIYEHLIGREYDGLDRSADVRISRLRKKLGDNAQNPFRIKTIWGKGFFFVADAWR